MAITPDDAALIAKLVAQSVADAMKAKAEAFVDAKKKALPEEQVQRDAALAKAFEKAGYKDIILLDRTKTLAEQGSTVTILTFNKWMELGRRPKEGEHATKFRFEGKGFPLRYFHKSQTRVATVEERRENFAKMQAAIKRHEDEKAAKGQSVA